MTSMKWSFGILGGIALLAVLTTAPAAGSVRCLPTCDATDGRFLAIAGTGFDTLSPPELDLSIAVPAGSASFDVGIFDGDGGEYDPFGDANWDAGVTALFSYSLYADPNADGTGLVPVDLAPGQPTILSPGMPDNQWIDFTVSTGPAAKSPSGNYFYVLKINLVVPTLVTLNSFKVRSSATLSGLTLDPVERPFSYIAPWTTFTDLAIVYPNFPDPLPTTYDGTFRFFFDVPVSQGELVLWDGDFDRGKFDLTEQDTDDPDTPGFPFVPSWATLDTAPEGVAVGGAGTGSPADDTNAADFSGEYILREPSVRYELTVPGGPVLANENPSGNQEWERFAISTAPFDPAQMDYSVPSIPPGVYKLEILGVDMLNLNALLLPFRLLCVEETGEPCTPLRPYLLGDTVFTDTDGDGFQDPGEAGIAGVLLELYDARGTLLGSTTTDANGRYSFGVEKEAYVVRVAASNFSGPLAGTTSTTGGDSRARTITRGNNALDVDFGYRGPGGGGEQPGTGTLGYWKNHPEAWPVAQITIGGITYSKAQAIAVMGNPGKGDKTYDLFKQLVAAKLNVLIGNASSCISATISAADAWMASHPPGSGVKASSSAWTVAGPLHQTLDDYNNGRLCAPHRD